MSYMDMLHDAFLNRGDELKQLSLLLAETPAFHYKHPHCETGAEE